MVALAYAVKVDLYEIAWRFQHKFLNEKIFNRGYIKNMMVAGKVA